MIYECQRWNIHGSHYIKFPVRFIHKDFKIDRNLNFCLDTGSPFLCIVSYYQAINLRIRYEKLSKLKTPILLGGTKWDNYLLEGSNFIMRSNIGKLRTIEITPISVLGPPINRKLELPVPGILGFPFLSQFTLVVEKIEHEGKIYLTDDKVTIIET